MNSALTFEPEPGFRYAENPHTELEEASTSPRPAGQARAQVTTGFATPLPSRTRAGAPTLTNSWIQLRAALRSTPATRREFEFEDAGNSEDLIGSNEFEFETAIQAPKIQVQKSFPLPSFGPAPAGPLIVTITGRITLRGSVQHGNPQSAIKLSPGQQKADFEAKVYESWGKISLTGSIEPGKISQVGIKFGTESVDVEFSAGIDFTKLFRASVTPKKIFTGSFKFGDWTFEGRIVPTLDIYITPRPGAVIAAAKAVGQAGRLVVAIGRGLLFAGELGVGTTLGAAALGVGIALGGIAWIGLGLYLIGKAHQDGRALAFGFTFNSGYASMLARLTSGQPVFEDSPAGQRKYWYQLTYDWRHAVEVYRPRWVEAQDRNALGKISALGEIAALQDFALFLQIHGPEEWARVSAHHRTKYHKETGFRRQRYHAIMNRQLRAGKPVGIPLEPVR